MRKYKTLSSDEPLRGTYDEADSASYALPEGRDDFFTYFSESLHTSHDNPSHIDYVITDADTAIDQAISVFGGEEARRKRIRSINDRIAKWRR